VDCERLEAGADMGRHLTIMQHCAGLEINKAEIPNNHRDMFVFRDLHANF
jgi:hypothetical protein